jgi:hypothetical protein
MQPLHGRHIAAEHPEWEPQLRLQEYKELFTLGLIKLMHQWQYQSSRSCVGSPVCIGAVWYNSGLWRDG